MRFLLGLTLAGDRAVGSDLTRDQAPDHEQDDT